MGPLVPCFGLLVIIAMCFEAGIDPLLVCFQTWLQWIPQIHLRCNTYSTLDSKNYSREADQDYSAPSCTLSAQDFFFNFIQFFREIWEIIIEWCPQLRGWHPRLRNSGSGSAWLSSHGHRHANKHTLTHMITHKH